MIAHKEPVAPEMAHQEDGIKINPVNVGALLFPLLAQAEEVEDDVKRADVRARPAELEEDGVRISLTVVDTPGFGDQIDNEFTCVPLRSPTARSY